MVLSFDSCFVGEKLGRMEGADIFELVHRSHL